MFDVRRHRAQLGTVSTGMEAPPLERKLVAILAADVEGYSRMMEIDEEGTLATLSAHRTITDELIAQHSGRIFGTAGDSVLAEFASVFSAVQCAIDIQRELAIANKPLDEARRLRFRIGINVGDVMVKDGDIFGDGVNIAARLEGLAEPGGICISRGVRDHIRHKLPHKFEDLGEQAVKNIAQPVRCFRLLPRRGQARAAAAARADLAAVGTAQAAPQRRRPGGRAGVLGIDQGQPAAGRLRGLSRAVSRGQLRHAGPYPARRIHRLRTAPRERRPIREIELAFWESVRDSRQLRNRCRPISTSIPTGEFCALAEIRLKELGEAAGDDEIAAYCGATRRLPRTAAWPCSGGTSATSQPGSIRPTFIETST